MRYPAPLIEGRLVRRYLRFLADVALADGSIITAHTPNTGSLAGCCIPGSRVWLRDTGSATRKYPHTWELVEPRPDVIVGINTGLPPTLVQEALREKRIRQLKGYTRVRPEVRYGRENSRIDLLLSGARRADCYVEIKNVTLAEAGTAFFPDAVSTRAVKHLRELERVVAAGSRGVIFFCVQRGDVREVRPADHIDPAYGRSLRRALKKGVEAIAYAAEVSPHAVRLHKPLPLVCP
jgi:sugar fermentation stimulation protein A